MTQEELLKALEQVRANVGMPMTETMVRRDEAVITEAMAALKQPRLPDGVTVEYDKFDMITVKTAGEINEYFGSFDKGYDLLAKFVFGPSPAKAGEDISGKIAQGLREAAAYASGAQELGSDPHATVTGQEGVRPSQDSGPYMICDRCGDVHSVIAACLHPTPAPEKRQTLVEKYMIWRRECEDDSVDVEDFHWLLTKLDEDRKARGE